jgi:pyridoxamine 5'-phosphate oxidase-like protein
MRWSGFEAACPRIAALARDRFTADELVMLGTIRADGSPRISGNEADFVDGHLFLGMMWESRKALDLRRDPRCTVHSVPHTRMNPGGDVKLSGTAYEVSDLGVRTAYRDAIRRRIDWAPDEPRFHLFGIDVERAAYIAFGHDPVALAWDVDQGFRELRHPDAGRADVTEPGGEAP